MTLKKVAERAGVSVSTASKALTDSREVSPETRLLVINAAKELGYFGETKKRRLTNRRKDSVSYAILCPEIISVHYSGFVTGFCKKIAEKGGKASVFITEFDPEKKKNTIERCLSEKDIDAVLCLETVSDFDPEGFPLPIVFSVKQKGCCCVYSDIDEGIDKAVKYLVSLGHKKIAYAGEPLTASKQKAFCKSMIKYLGGFCEEYIYVEEGRFETSGNRIAIRIIKNKEKMPTAIIAAYDEIAYGLLHSFKTSGVRIPEDVSVIGINDIPTSKYLETPLTSVGIRTDEMVLKAIEFLEKQLDGHSVREEHAVTCELKIRESTAIVKQ